MTSWHNENWKTAGSKTLGHTSSGKPIPVGPDEYKAAGLKVEGPISANGIDDFNPLPASKWQDWTVKDHEDAAKAHEAAAKKIHSTHKRTDWMNDDPIEMQRSFHEGFARMHTWEAKDMRGGG